MLESAPGSSPIRCLLRDTVVPIPEPEELIVNYIEPSHVVVQRCTGKTERMHAWDGWGGNGVSVRLSRSPLLQVFVLAFPPPSPDNGGRPGEKEDISTAAVKTLAILTSSSSFRGGAAAICKVILR